VRGLATPLSDSAARTFATARLFRILEMQIRDSAGEDGGG
jgi:hypothetical protein